MKFSDRRRHIGLKGELLLVLAPTLTVLLVLALVEWLSRQQLLFASLASSAFLIYLDPLHAVNRVVVLVVSQMTAAGIGLLAFVLLGPGYLSAGTAMIIVIALLVGFDLMHPPAVSTALSFGLRASGESNLALFMLALGLTITLVSLQLLMARLLQRLLRKQKRPIG